jgi:hypothetical protein
MSVHAEFVVDKMAVDKMAVECVFTGKLSYSLPKYQDTVSTHPQDNRYINTEG